MGICVSQLVRSGKIEEKQLEEKNKENLHTRRLSVESDSCLADEISFSRKPVNFVGCDEKLLNSLGVSYACRKGLNSRSRNQDSFCIQKLTDELTLLGVFDGHGVNGEFVSEFAKSRLPRFLLDEDLTNPLQALERAFSKTFASLEKLSDGGILNANASGTTITICLLLQNMLYIGHVGDSRCVLGIRENSLLKAMDLTRDHRPNCADERRRIESSGGEVKNRGPGIFRVYAKGKKFPGLNMSRALGDLRGTREAGISPHPEVNCYSTENAEILILASDGIWEYCSSQEAVETSSRGAAELAQLAWKRWIEQEIGHVVDDITCIVVFLKEYSILGTDF